MANNVKGLDRLLRQLKSLPDKVLQETQDALYQGAEDLSQAIARAAPHKSGALQDSVGWSKNEGGSITKQYGLSVVVHAGDDKAYYAKWVEYGTAAHGSGAYRDRRGKRRNAGAGHHATRAQPFFGVTVRLYKSRLKSRVGRAMNKAAKAAAAVQ